MRLKRCRALFLVAALFLGAALVLGASGCGQGVQGSQDGQGDQPGEDTVTVFAAASLKPAFTRLAAGFEAAHPGSRVLLNFAGSSDLATQITQGAPADVFASADEANMDKLEDAGLVTAAPRDFATNSLVIAVPPANPAKVKSFEDLARPGVKVVVCASQVPCGAAARTAAHAAGIRLQPASEESSVADVLGKVVSAEADAGLVYVTDARNAGEKVISIPFAEASQAVNRYPIAALHTSKGSDRHRELATAFVDLVTGSEGQRELAQAGFGAP